MDTEKHRTAQQNRALHLWFRHVSKVLNDSGLDQKAVIQALVDRGLDVPWTESSVKENIWRPVFRAMAGKESTTEADRTEFDAEYRALCKYFAQEFGVQLPPWPDRWHSE